MYLDPLPKIVFLLAAILIFCAGCATSGRGVAPAALVSTAISATPGPSPTANVVTLRPARTASPAITPSATALSASAAPPSTDSAACAPPFDPVAFLPDNTRLLGITAANGQWTAQVFNLQTYKIEDEIEAPYMVYKAALSPDGRILAWALEDHSIRLVDLSDHKEIGFLEGHLNMIVSLKFSPDGERLFSASHDGWVRIWDLQGKLLGGFQPGGEVVGLGVSPDGRRLATIPMEGHTVIWDLEKERKLAEYEGSIFGGYDGSDAAFSGDGQYFAAGLGGAGAISLWRLSDSELLWRGGTFALAFSPDSSLFAHSDFDANQNSLIVLRSADGQEVVRTLEGHAGMVWRLVFSPDSKLLASFNGGPARLWQVSDGLLLYTWPPACAQ